MCIARSDERDKAKESAIAFLTTLKQWQNFRKGELLPKLESLDRHFTAQWIGVNTAKTAVATTAVGSFVMLFVFPPVALGLGIGAAVAGTATTIGDIIAEKVKDGEFGSLLAKDDELCKALMRAAKEMQEAVHDTARKHEATIEEVLRALSADLPDQFWAMLGQAAGQMTAVTVAGTQTVQGTIALVQLAQCADEIAMLGQGASGAVTMTFNGAKITGMGVSTGAQAGTRVVASVGTKVFGGIGAAFSVGDAVFSWATSKNGQDACRKTIVDVKKAIEDVDAKFDSL